MPITETQRQRRAKYLGASDKPVICLGREYPYKKRPIDVYYSKQDFGELDPEKENDPSKTAGNRMEGVLLDWAAEQLGVQIVKNQFRVCKTGDGAAILAASHDALIKGKREGLEAKIVGMGNPSYHVWGDEGTDEIPMDVVIQCQQQMEVSELDRIWVPVGYETGYQIDWRLYSVPRSDEVIKVTDGIALPWWHAYVEVGIPPVTRYCVKCEADADLDVVACPTCGGEIFAEREPEPPPIELLKRIRREPESWVDLPPDALRIVFEYQQAKLREKDEKEAAEEQYARILEMMGTAEGGRLTDGREITYLSQKSAPKCDHVRLRAKWPEAHAECVTQGEHRVLRIKEPKKGKGE